MEHREPTDPSEVPDLDDRLDREAFLLHLVQRLAETIEETVGLEDCEAFVSAAGSQIGEQISRSYGDAATVPAKDPAVEQRIAEICIDLKARIQGGFYVESIDKDRIVLRNTRCPFGKGVVGHPSLCMMTTHVFGRVASDRAGYAAVHIDEAIATGDSECRVVIDLDRDSDPIGREFFA